MKWRRAGTGLALIGSGLAGGLLLAEGAVRGYAAVSGAQFARDLRARDPYAVLVVPHATVGYRQKPGSAFHYGNGTTAYANTMGFRGPPVAVPKPAGTFRIVLVGGSTTHGWGVDDGATIDAYMRELLRQRHPGRSIEVVNLAFDGYDSYQDFEGLASDGVRLDPDVVIVNAGVNDVRNARFGGLRDRDPRTLLWVGDLTRLREEERTGHRAPWTVLKHFAVLVRIPGVLRAHRAAGRPAAVTPHPDALDYFERNLQRIVDLMPVRTTAVLFSTPPSSLRAKYRPDETSTRRYWVGDAQMTQAYRDSLDTRMRRLVDRQRAAGRRIGYVPHDPIAPELFLDDAHLTPDGNRRVAADFANAVEPFIGAGPAAAVLPSGG